MSRSRTVPSYVIAGVIALAAVAWLATGNVTGNGNGNGPKTAEAPAPAANSGASDIPAAPAGEGPLVRVRTLKAEPRQADLLLRGQTQAIRKVQVKSETSGVVAAVPVEKGTRVAEGDVICELEVAARQAMVDQAKARARQAKLEYDAARKLSAQGHRSETQAAASLAAYEGAQAELRRMEVELEQTKIRAPFDGIVDDRRVEVGDYMTPGSTCALVIDDNPFLVVGQVPERNVGTVTLGQTGGARLITGEDVEGRIRFLANSADPVTRTFLVELEVPNEARTLRDGVTAELRVPTRTVVAHRISPAILSLDEAGRIGVRVVENDMARFTAVEIIADGSDGIWVTGLPETVTVITVGQEFVSDGQRVRTVSDDPLAATNPDDRQAQR